MHRVRFGSHFPLIFALIIGVVMLLGALAFTARQEAALHNEVVLPNLAQNR